MASAREIRDKGSNRKLVGIICSENYHGNKVIDIKDLLDKGADVNFQDEDQENMTLLKLAINKNELNIVKLLVEHGASVHGNSDDEDSPLKLAERLGMSDALQFLNVCLRLDSYVKSMVELFLSKLKDYEKEIQPGNNVAKSGKTAGGVATAVEGASAAVPVVGSKGIGKLTGKIATYVGEKQHRKKAKTIEAALFSFDEDRRKNIIALASLEIFRSFEKQFSEITGENGNWQRDLEKLGEDAVNRIMNYIKKSDEEFFNSLITKAVINGESKEGFAAMVTPKKVQSFKKMPKPGRTVHVPDKNWNTSELFSSAGIVKIENNSRHYYELKTGDLSKKYGYRLAFNWEAEGNDLTKFEFRPNFQPDQDYKYSLESINLQKMAANIVKVIDSGDLLKIASGTKKAVDNVDEKVNTVQSTVVEIKDMLQQHKTTKFKKITFGVNQLVIPYTERTKILKDITTFINDYVVVVTGLGGVGKTELTSKYIFDHFDYYNCIIFVDASSSESFNNLFYELSSDLGISKRNAADELKSMKCIINDVFLYVDEKTIFIFDNAESILTVQEFLKIAMLQGPKKPHILITSLNNCVWTSDRFKIKCLTLEEFTDTEALTFVKEALEIMDESQNETISRLTLKLHNLPLALKQAVTFIIQERQNIDGENFNITDYLNKYEECPNLCLDYEAPNDAYIKTVYKTFCLTVNKIKKTGNNGMQALKILNIMSYLASTNIPIDIFKNKLACDDPENFKMYMKVLVNYSLVSIIGDRQDTKELKIHGLVQEVRRLKLQGKGLEANTLTITLELLRKNVCDYYSAQSFRPHIITAWNHAYCYPNLVESFFVNDTVRNYELLNEKDYYPIDVWFSCDVFKTIFRNAIVTKPIYGCDETHLPPHLEETLVNILSPETANMVPKDYQGVSDSNLKIIKLLFSNTTTVDNWRFYTPLHFAVHEGYCKVVNLLLERNALVDPKIFDRCTPLHLAAKSGHIRIVKILIKRGANFNATDVKGYTPLHFAALRGHTAVASALLENNVDVDAQDRIGATPLHMAAFFGHVDVANILLAHGADLNAATNKQNTPMHFAAMKGHDDVIVALLESDIGVNASDKDNAKQLHEGKVDVKVILPANNKQKSALHLAALRGNADVVATLLADGAGVNAPFVDGCTPLHLAARRGHEGVVLCLLKHPEILVDATNKYGDTPLSLAASGDHTNIVNILIANNADSNLIKNDK